MSCSDSDTAMLYTACTLCSSTTQPSDPAHPPSPPHHHDSCLSCMSQLQTCPCSQLACVQSALLRDCDNAKSSDTTSSTSCRQASLDLPAKTCPTASKMDFAKKRSSFCAQKMVTQTQSVPTVLAAKKTLRGSCLGTRWPVPEFVSNAFLSTGIEIIWIGFHADFRVDPKNFMWNSLCAFFIP